MTPTNGEVIVDKRNALHYENMSISLAESLGNAGEGFIYSKMAFGNGGTSIDPNRNYYVFNTYPTGTNASLYNQPLLRLLMTEV